MRISAKPIHSPNRAAADTFPPSLITRFRSNGRSNSTRRSLRKSLSSPMFRKKSSIEMEEPSSPKVTCFGQVRVKSTDTTTKSRSWGFKKQDLFCNCFSGKRASRKSKTTHSSEINVWRRFFMAFQVGSREKVEVARRNGVDDDQISKEDNQKTQFEQVVSFAPRNALLLMRSRSEPLRASSLANRFWGSPLRREEEEAAGKDEENKEEPPSPPPPPPPPSQLVLPKSQNSPRNRESEPSLPHQIDDEKMVKIINNYEKNEDGNHNKQISHKETCAADTASQEDHPNSSSHVHSRSSSASSSLSSTSSMKVSEYWVSSYGSESKNCSTVVAKLVERDDVCSHQVVLTRCKSEPARSLILEDDKVN